MFGFDVDQLRMLVHYLDKFGHCSEFFLVISVVWAVVL